MGLVVRALIFGFLLLPHIAGASEPLLSAPRFFTLSTTNGLTQDSVSDMLLDRDGFLYIGSAGGLDRWDGYRINRIVGNNNELLDAAIYRLYQDQHGFIWISTEFSGVFRLDPKDSSIEAIAQVPVSGQTSFYQYANSFSEDAQGNVHIALDEQVIVFNHQSQTTTTAFKLEDTLILRNEGIRWSLPIGQTIIVATSFGVFAQPLNGEAIELLYLPEADKHIDSRNAKYLYLDSDNQFWIATVRGLYVADLKNVTDAIERGDGLIANVKNAIPERNVWRIIEESPNRFWVGTDIGLLSLDASDDNKTQHILEPMKGLDVLSRKDIQDIEIDRDGNLWLGTNFGGVLYWSPTSLNFSTLKIERGPQGPSLTDNTVWGLFEDDNRQLWIGTDNGLTQYNTATKTSTLFFKKDVYLPYSDSSFDRIFEVDSDTLILQSQFGLWQFNKITGERKIVETSSEEQHAIVSNYIYGSGQDSQGRIWFTFNGEFFMYDPQKKQVEELNFTHDFDTDFFYSFLDYDSIYSDRMWVSVYGALWLISPNDFSAELVHQLPATLLTRELYPSSLAHDQQGILWVTYPGVGLYGLDAKTFEQVHFLNANDVLSTNIVYGLKVDDNDNLWFSSHSGIHRLDPNRNTIHNYRYGLELSIAEFNEGAVEVLQSGDFAYGSPSGVMFFNPENVVGLDVIESTTVISQSRAEQMAITEVALANRDVNMPLVNLNKNTLTLDHIDNGLTIRFSNLRFAQRETSTYAYTLTRDNRVISSAKTQESVVSFPILEPGNYQFSVTSAGSLSMQPAVLNIQVKHAPWTSPKAKAFYLLIGALLLITVWWFRQRQRSHLAYTRSQLRLFGDAFKQTRDWVVIFSREYEAIAVNPAFEKAFALDPSVPLDQHFDNLQYTYPDLWKLTHASLRTLDVGKFWRDERQLQLADGRNHDVLIDVSAVSEASKPDEITHYLMVLSDISEQKQAERKLLKLATYDNLTGLVNRSLLLDRLEHAIANAKQHNDTIAILFVDLDRFKGINDSLGHEYGDNLLRVIAKRMQGLASQNDTVARMGGDEFVIVHEEVESFDAVSSFIQKLIESIEEPISINGETLRVSCSVGVSMFPNDAQQPADLLRYADVAMYSAKSDSLNSFKFFTEEMNVRAKQRLSVENLVKKAYQNELFFNVYQPIVNIKTCKTEGMELLLRCAISEQPLSPAEFIPILEELRLIVEVTRKSVIEGLKQLSLWYKSGYRGYLSVNLSALHFTASFDLKLLERLLIRLELPKSALRFEVTESILMSDKAIALKQFNALKKEGYLLALDDFGTGYSSLSYLKLFPLDVIKIDKSFTDDIGQSDSGESLIVTTIGMAKNLNMDCIAEGIETLEQVKFLSQQNCHQLQGYYFSKPMTEDMALTVATKQWDKIEP